MRPATERCITFTAQRKVELLERPAPQTPLAPDEVAGPTLVSLISPGTEIQGQLLGDSFPVEPGYAAVCEIAELGSKVTDLKIGDRVLVSGPAGIGGHHGWQRAPRAAAVKLPDNLPAELGVYARLIGVTMASLSRTAAHPPQRVAIFGLGPIGYFGALAAKAMRYDVVAIDPDASRRALLADISIATFASREEALTHNAGEAAFTLECSGVEPALIDACFLTRKRGEVFMVGVPWRKRTETPMFDLMHVVFRRFLTLHSGSEWVLQRYPSEYPDPTVFGGMTHAMTLLANGAIRPGTSARLAGSAASAQTSGGGAIDRIVPITEAPAAYETLLTRSQPLLTTILNWQQ